MPMMRLSATAASSMRRTEASRVTVRGATTAGKRTLSRRGRMESSRGIWASGSAPAPSSPASSETVSMTTRSATERARSSVSGRSSGSAGTTLFFSVAIVLIYGGSPLGAEFVIQRREFKIPGRPAGLPLDRNLRGLGALPHPLREGDNQEAVPVARLDLVPLHLRPGRQGDHALERPEVDLHLVEQHPVHRLGALVLADAADAQRAAVAGQLHVDVVGTH